MEARRTSQTRRFESVFLLSYSRLLSSPSTWICAPLVSVLANSESLPKTTQRCHSVCEMYLSSFLYEDFVASESVVKLPLLAVRTSGLLPRKPMRVTLFWYMRVSPFVEFARCCSGHTGRSLASGPAPKCRRSAFWEGPERSLRGVLCRGSQTCFGRNLDPEGTQNAKQKTECRRAPERPRSCGRARDGYITADKCQSKVLICTLAAEVHRNCSAIRAGMSAVRRTQFASVVARRKALVRRLHRRRGQVGKAIRISRMKGHE